MFWQLGQHCNIVYTTCSLLLFSDNWDEIYQWKIYIALNKSLLIEIQNEIKTMTHFFWQLIRNRLFIQYIFFNFFLSTIFQTIIFIATIEPKIKEVWTSSMWVIWNESRKWAMCLYVNFLVLRFQKLASFLKMKVNIFFLRHMARYLYDLTLWINVL